MKDREYMLLENVAAISGGIHHDARFQQFYDAMEGSMSVYQTVIELAQELMKWEEEHATEELTAYDELEVGWYEVIDAIVDFALSEVLEGSINARKLVLAAVEAVQKNALP